MSGAQAWGIRAAAGVGSLYALVCGLARANYRQFVYPAAADRVAASSNPEGVERLHLTAADGTPVTGLWLASDSARRLVVYFHGNGNVAEDLIPLGRDLVQRGLAVLLVEYRGYGASAGAAPAPGEEGLGQDAEAALAEAKRRGFPPERVALWGNSLGTGVAAEMAARGRGARLVLVSPFTSLRDAARAHAPWWIPMSLVIPDRYDTLAKASRLRVPTLVVHGEQDEVIPFAQGRLVARAITGARFVSLPTGHHNDVYAVGGEPLMQTIVRHCAE